MNKTRILESKKNLEEAARMLGEAAEGKVSLTSVSRALGLTPQRLNTEMNKEFVPYIRKYCVMDEETILAFLENGQTPWEKLASAVIGLHEKVLILPEETESLFSQKVKEDLSERELRVLTRLYGLDGSKPLSSSETARQEGVSTNRIQQITATAIRKLRIPSRGSSLLSLLPNYGRYVTAINELESFKEKDGFYEEKFLETSKKMQELVQQKVLTDLMLQVFDKKEPEIDRHWKTPLSLLPEIPDDWKSALARHGVNTIKRLRDLNENTLYYISRQEKVSILKLFKACDEMGLSLCVDSEQNSLRAEDISNLNLSVRTYNALSRKGIRTVSDVLALTEKDLMSIRNMGKKSVSEIVSAITDLGYQLKKE